MEQKALWQEDSYHISEKAKRFMKRRDGGALI